MEYDQVGKPHDGNLDWPEKTGWWQANRVRVGLGVELRVKEVKAILRVRLRVRLRLGFG